MEISPPDAAAPAPVPRALEALMARAADVGAVWAGALLRESSPASVEADARAMSDDGVVRVVETLAVLARQVEALQVRLAAELDDRCTGIAGDDVAKAMGFSTPERLVAHATGGRQAEAAALVRLGRATATRPSFTGGLLAPKRPFLAAAVERGELGVEAAETIRRFLERVELRADPGELAAAEEFLVQRAARTGQRVAACTAVGADGLARLVKRLEAQLDPDGVKPREDELRARRGLTLWQDASGMIRVRGALDPVGGAALRSALDGLVGAELHRARDARAPFGARARHAAADAAVDGDPALAEHRTIAQMYADALVDVSRHALGCRAMPVLRQAMVVARVELEALVAGRGSATIDGIEQPVSLDAVRELVSSAGLAPLVVGSGDEPLHLGRSARLFTPAQKLALADRDGGCAWPACTRPPSHTEAHHIAWWGRDDGPTDLDNGVLLCSHHHHRVHDDGWRVRIRDGRSWFVPPAHLDPEQLPRPGNTSIDREFRRRLQERRAPAPAVA
ncbi:HNH endonuclease signature motif containing protein [Agromyces soli]|uniref:HNH endonuclease n=1 Tax=Agromyces soli TaxID=659012 RepID=A0ABY4AX79_9MICO|nr:HNH endonuclease signature motif containing protein [Agromyces soli]UOE27778.1 HNH endonuclease [Agromyces soli]